MKDNRKALWTIDELGRKVAEALSVDYEGAPNDRVRAVPDRRTIRYYTTLGLLDRATEMRGRTAYYGERHLLQLVAIKRLQASGSSLADVQHRLVGITQGELARLARLPASLGDASGEQGEGPPQTKAAAKAKAESPENKKTPRGAFWKEVPESRVSSNPREASSDQEKQSERTRGETAVESQIHAESTAESTADPPLSRLLQAVRLGNGATLLLEELEPVTEVEIQAIREAAEPLLRLLARRRAKSPASQNGRIPE